MNITRTYSRDEMIAYSEGLVETAREAFLRDPTKKHTILINGDMASGKSLIVDTFRSRLFDEGLSRPKERIISSYRGEIEGNNAEITLINAKGYSQYCPYSESLIAIGRQFQNSAGFLFILNRNPKNLGTIWKPYALPDTLMDIHVNFPEPHKVKWTATYLALKSGIPKTWDREITCEMYADL